MNELNFIGAILCLQTVSTCEFVVSMCMIRFVAGVLRRDAAMIRFVAGVASSYQVTGI